MFEGNDTRFYLYGAYLDIRETNPVPSVRIVGLIETDKVYTVEDTLIIFQGLSFLHFKIH